MKSQNYLFKKFRTNIKEMEKIKGTVAISSRPPSSHRAIFLLVSGSRRLGGSTGIML